MSDKSLPQWTRKFLLVASVYYLLCGVTAIFIPSIWFFVAGVTQADPIQSELLLAVIGAPMIALSVACLLSAFAPKASAGLLVVVLVANVVDILVNVHAGGTGALPILNVALFIGVDLFWCVGVLAILWCIYRLKGSAESEQPISLAAALETKPVGSEKTLGELSDERPVLLLLIRHAGCTFCREQLSRLAKERVGWKSPVPSVIVVGLSSPDKLKELLVTYNLQDLLYVSDPDRLIYRALEVKRGTIYQLLGPKALWDALFRGSLYRHGFGGIEGDPFQLPGSALIRRRKVVSSQAANSASDYCEFQPLLAEAAHSQ